MTFHGNPLESSHHGSKIFRGSHHPFVLRCSCGRSHRHARVGSSIRSPTLPGMWCSMGQPRASTRPAPISATGPPLISRCPIRRPGILRGVCLQRVRNSERPFDRSDHHLLSHSGRDRLEVEHARAADGRDFSGVYRHRIRRRGARGVQMVGTRRCKLERRPGILPEQLLPLDPCRQRDVQSRRHGAKCRKHDKQ